MPMQLIIDQLLSTLRSSGVLTDRSHIQEVQYFPSRFGDIAFRVNPAPSLSDHRSTTQSTDISLIRQITSVGNYLNIQLNPTSLAQALFGEMEKSGKNLGLIGRLKGRHIVVEHTSINPVYPINVATFRSSVVGHAIAEFSQSLGATASVCFWVEDLARQLDVVLSAMRTLGWDTSDISSLGGKSDHTLAAVFAMMLHCAKYKAKCGDVDGIHRMFPLADTIPSFDDLEPELLRHALQSEELRPLTRTVCGTCLRGYQQTFDVADIRVDNYDFASDIMDSFLGAVNLIELRSSQRSLYSEITSKLVDKAAVPSYRLRNVAYYWFMLSQGDKFVSVVPLRQRRQLENYAELAQSIHRQQVDRTIELVFYGDVVIDDEDLDSIKEGRFHSVDAFINMQSEIHKLPPSVIAAALKYHFLQLKTGQTARLYTTSPNFLRGFLHIVALLLELRAVAENRARSAKETAQPLAETDVQILKRVLLFSEKIKEVESGYRFHALSRYVNSLVQDVNKCLHPVDSTMTSNLSTDLVKAVYYTLLNALRLLGISAEPIMQAIIEYSEINPSLQRKLNASRH